MKIAVNLIPFTSVSGVEIFTKHILAPMLAREPEHFLILRPEGSPAIFDDLAASGAEILTVPHTASKLRRAWYQQVHVPRLLRKHRVDLLFCPSLHAPVFCRKKIVVIHDCAYDRYREFENLFSKYYFKLMFYGAKYASRKIVVPSDFAKRELMELYRVPEGKIAVLPEGAPDAPETSGESAMRTLQKFSITRPYFLYIGNWRPRKNLEGLLDAFRILKETHGRNEQLVVGGKKDLRFIDIEKEVERRGLSGDVIATDFLSEEEKAGLYQKAIALAFPSYYEGFGIPVLEAQAAGVPVVTSNTSSLPEVGGDGARYVDPHDPDDIARGLYDVATQPTLREELIRKGRANVARFDWKASAGELLRLFHALV